MASDQCYSYKWEVSRAKHIIPETKSLPANIFFIQIQSRYYVRNQNLQAKDHEEQFQHEPISPMKMKSVVVGKDSLLKKGKEAQDALCNALDFLGIPAHLHQVVVDDIVAFGKKMVDFTPYRDVLPMVFEFVTTTLEATDESDYPELKLWVELPLSCDKAN